MDLLENKLIVLKNLFNSTSFTNSRSHFDIFNEIFEDVLILNKAKNEALADAFTKLNNHNDLVNMVKQPIMPNNCFINQTELVFDDISSECYREYTFPNGLRLLINKPIYLNVSKSGGHRLFAENNICYYIQPKEGWYIKWFAENGQPNFVK